MSLILNERSLSQERLISAYYAGNDSALETLWKQYRPRLERFFQNGGLREDDAQDRAQDVFVRIMVSRHRECGGRAKRFDPQGQASFNTWIFTIARRLLVDTWRRAERSIPMSALAIENESGEVEWYEDRLPGEGLSPEAWTIDRQDRLDALACVALLPERERVAMALWLGRDGDVTLQEMASALEASGCGAVSVSTAYRVRASAYQHLRASLERVWAR